MKTKKLNIIEEASETIKVNSKDMKLDELTVALAGLAPAYRKEVIRTAKKLAKAYKVYQDLQVELEDIKEMGK
jgi:hypothetical protein